MDFGNCTMGQQRNQTASDFSCPSAYANWLVIILLVIFLLVTNVLLMNLLIAMFSYTFQVVQGNADIFWKFQRYNLIVEYHGRPAFAPPFIIIDHVKLFLRWAFKKTEHKKEHLERDIPEELDQKLITWEMLQKENYLENLEIKKKESNEEKLKKMSDKVDSLLKNFSGLKEQEKQLRSLESKISYCRVMLSSMADTLMKNSLFFSRPILNYKRTDQMVVPENEDRGETSQLDDVMYIDN